MIVIFSLFTLQKNSVFETWLEWKRKIGEEIIWNQTVIYDIFILQWTELDLDESRWTKSSVATCDKN